MSILKRAWLSVVRRKGKSLILLIVVFILGNLIAGTFAIKQATTRVEQNLKNKLGYNATVTIDYEKLYENIDDFSNFEEPVIPEEMIKKIGSLPEVKFYDYSRKFYLMTKTMKAIEMEGGDFEIYRSDDNDMSSQFSLQGVEHLDLLDVKVGRIEMVDGRVFNEEDLLGAEIPVILSEELMTANNYRLDEVIDVTASLENLMMGQEGDPLKLDYKFKIVGSFKPVTFGKDKDKNGNYSVVEMFNRIYLPNQFVKQMVDTEIKLAEEKGIDVSENYNYQDVLSDNFRDSVFITESDAALNSFVEQANEMISDGLIIKTSQEAFSMISFSMTMLASFASATLKGSALITVIVLSLVVVLFLRDRKHEMGIYLALGDRQWKVLSQVTLEVVMITLMGLTLSFGSALMLANKVSETMISNTYQEEILIDTSSSYLPAVNLSEVNDDYTIKITPSYVISIYAIGTAVAIAASVVPMFYVTRVKPKKILM